MIKLKKILPLFIAFILVISCKTNKFSFLDDYPVKNIPLVDSTSFSNHIEGKLLNKKEQKLLGLLNVFGEELNSENAKVGVSYLPIISDNFKSVVYYLYSNSTQLTCALVNYNLDFNIISSQLVSSDEIADGLLRSKATIYKDKIVLKEYVSDNASTIMYNILENGDITRE